ncbi:hypothetical protein QVA66_05440 [Staphylococcus chromogenes]|nr:hypothetical protein [Staphylococcus chromogenes]
MSKLVSIVDRLLVFAVGLITTAVGMLSIGLYFDIPAAQRLADAADLHSWLSVPEQDWYLPAVIAAGLVALVATFFIIAMNLKSNRIRRINTVATNQAGSIDLDVSAIAAAVADSFEDLPRVIRAHSLVQVDRGHHIMTITVTADPSASLSRLTTLAEQANHDIVQAIGVPDMVIRFKFHFAPVERSQD